MATIEIKGEAGIIYKIVRELRVRITRGLVTVSGDIDNPEKKYVPVKAEGKPIGKMNKDELKIEVKKLEGITGKGVEEIMAKTNKKIVKEIKAWNPPVPKVEEKEEKSEVETKEEKKGAGEDKKKKSAK